MRHRPHTLAWETEMLALKKVWVCALCWAWLARISWCNPRWFGLGFPAASDNTPKNFQIYWNVPTFMCHEHGIDFKEVTEKFGFIQNDKDKFRGDEITILYDPGAFPALLTDEKGNIVRRNGGIPQEGNLTFHLDHFRRHLIEQIPSSDFSGLGVIDFESWRPVFRQNWASLQIYRDLSLDIERERHPSWDAKVVQREAVRRFQKAAREFMEKTLDVVRKIRPKAEWGYYAYPYCYNWKATEINWQCEDAVIEENDQMSWLFGNADVLYPSVYLQHKMTPNQRVAIMRGRVLEAVRLAKKSRSKKPAKVFVYYWFKYQDQREIYVSENDIVNTVGELAKSGADGLIIWGSSNDLNSKSKCEGFQRYLRQSLGPSVLQARPTSTL